MIDIRQLTKADSLTYRKVRLQCLQNHPDHFGTTYDEEIVKPQIAFEKYLLDDDLDHIIFGAFSGKTCIGLCGFARETRFKTRHRGEIVQMYVDENFEGQGTGKKLLQAVVNHAFSNPEIEQITLSVVASNTRATRLYENCGFVAYANINNYFKLHDQYWAQKFYILEKSLFISNQNKKC